MVFKRKKVIIKIFFFYKVFNNKFFIFFNKQSIVFSIIPGCFVGFDYTNKHIFFYIDTATVAFYKFLFVFSKSELVLLRFYRKQLFLKGLGYRFSLEDNLICFKLGYSNKILFNFFILRKYLFFTEHTSGLSLVFLSKNIVFLHRMVYSLFCSYKPRPYTGKGFLLFTKKEAFKYSNLKKK